MAGDAAADHGRCGGPVWRCNARPRAKAKAMLGFNGTATSAAGGPFGHTPDLLVPLAKGFSPVRCARAGARSKEKTALDEDTIGVR